MFGPGAHGDDAVVGDADRIRPADAADIRLAQRVLVGPVRAGHAGMHKDDLVRAQIDPALLRGLLGGLADGAQRHLHPAVTVARAAAAACTEDAPFQIAHRGAGMRVALIDADDDFHSCSERWYVG